MVNMCTEVKACPFGHLGSRDYVIQVEMYDVGVIYLSASSNCWKSNLIFYEKNSAVVLTLKFWLYMGF